MVEKNQETLHIMTQQNEPNDWKDVFFGKYAKKFLPKNILMRFAATIEVLPSNNQDQEELKRMEHLDEKHFDPYYSQDSADIQDDSMQPGYIGSKIMDNGQLQGHVYGFEFIFEDNIPDADGIQDIVFYDEQLKKELNYDGNVESFFENTRNYLANKKIFYVSNLVCERQYSYYVKQMLINFVRNLKAAGYDLICFDALDDTLRLIFDENFNPKQRRLDAVSLKPLMRISADNCDSFVVLGF